MKYVARLSVAVAALAATGLAACSPIVDSRGNLPSPDALAQVKVGQSTQDEVQALLGTPSSTMVYGNDVWLYISSQTETVAFFAPKETERKVVAIAFDKDGKVAKVDALGLKDGEEVRPIARETPTAGKDYSILEQLLGNVGRFSKQAKGQ